MIHADKMTATMAGEFVQFLIGMRFNQPRKGRKLLGQHALLWHRQGGQPRAGEGAVRHSCGTAGAVVRCQVHIRVH
jgi:hypothetical protein